MKGIDRLSVIRHKSEINKDWKHTDLFRILRKEDIWIVANKNIKSNKRALIPGTTTKNLDKMSLTKLQRLREKVLNESYRFKAVKIPKLNRQKRLLGLSTPNDKIVQEVIRMILEAIYEPCLSEQSFCFRQGLGTHDALEHIEAKFCWVDWVIDIQSTSTTMDHKQLCKILGDKIQDVRFLNLIRKLLKCGILRQGKFYRSNLGIPQGNIVSPILANIYYNKLDKWVEKKAKMLNRLRTNQHHKTYKQLSYQISKKAEQLQGLDKRSHEYKYLLKELQFLKRRKAKIPSLAQKCIQIEYVRYTDDWIIGIKGNKVLANQLKVEVSKFMTVWLKQTMYPIKTKITNLRAEKAKFLGYEIYLLKNINISPYIRSRTRTTRCKNPQLQFDIPMDFVLQKMEEKGYIKKLVKRHRSISKVSHTTLVDTVIVKHFSRVWRGFSNYYSGCTKLSKLKYIHYLLHISCAMTLSHRHRLSTKKIFIKHGKKLTVANGHNTTEFPYRNKWSVRDRKWQNKREFVDPF